MNIKGIAIAGDHGGLCLKTYLKDHLLRQGYNILDCGTHTEKSVDYPDFAREVVKRILYGEYPRGILVCGTGQGMAMTANGYQGIRAAVCSDTFSARLSREHNDSNILCLGERVIGKGTALDVCEAWLKAKFEGGRHQKRVELLEIGKLGAKI